MEEKITHSEVYEFLENNFTLTIEERQMLTEYVNQQRRLGELLGLYKKFFDKLEISLRNTFDIDYVYPHEFLLGYDIKSEDKELIEIFKQIKEAENDLK